jgi:hypothetical protein
MGEASVTPSCHKSLPMVMVADQVRIALPLADRYPGRVALLFGPASARPNAKGLPYGLDNGRFVCWWKGLPWDEGAFLGMIRRAAKLPHPPLWLVVPDRVADAGGTFAEWRAWHPRLRGLGWPLARIAHQGETRRASCGI